MKTFLTILSLFCIGSSALIYAVPSQVMIIRHAEIDTEGNLSEKGLERAGALGPYFALTDFLLNFGSPKSIFAARPNPDSPTTSCLQTVGPTAQILERPVHTGFAEFQYKKLARTLLHKSTYEGRNILICWDRHRIQELASALGVVSAPEFPDVYDQVWVITFDPDATLTIYQQQLLFGDAP